MVLQKQENTINWCLRQDHFDLKRPNSAICRHRKTGISQKKSILHNILCKYNNPE